MILFDRKKDDLNGMISAIKGSFTLIFCDDNNVSSLTTLPLQIIFKLSQSRPSFEMIKLFSSLPVDPIGVSIESTNDFFSNKHTLKLFSYYVHLIRQINMKSIQLTSGCCCQ